MFVLIDTFQPSLIYVRNAQAYLRTSKAVETFQQCLKRDRLVFPDANKNDVIQGGG